MQTFFIVFGAFVFVMAIMAVGVILGRKPIAGSCGGIGAALGEKDYICEICGDDPAKCEEQTSGFSSGDQQQAPAFYDASASSNKAGS